MPDFEVREYGSRRLKSGETMAIKVFEPPVGEPYRSFDRLYWWDDMRDRVLDGQYSSSSLDRFFVGEVAGEIVGNVLLCAPADTRDVGLVEFVFTVPEHRSKAIMSRLLAVLIEDFRREGGTMLLLCTVNPVAAELYRKAGFVPHIGDGWRYLAPGNEDFDDDYLADSGEGTVRAATFGDMARFAALYNNPRLDWFTRYYVPFVEWRVFHGFRFEGHFRRLLNDSESGAGHLLVLESPTRRVVAAASLNEVPSYHEQHVKVLSFISAPAYVRQTASLLLAVVEESRSTGTAIVQTYVADFEEEKKRVLGEAGFDEEARLRNNLKMEGGETADLLVYARELQSGRELLRGPDQYYGGRQAYARITES